MNNHASLQTPIGRLWVESNGEALVRVGWSNPGCDAPARTDPLLDTAVEQLRAYFGGHLSRFDLPLVPAGSPRGEALRTAIAAIPYGHTTSYGDLARLAHSGARAIGQACARNPFAIIVPCHRVVGANGAIGAYSGGDGVSTKRILLSLENNQINIRS